MNQGMQGMLSSVKWSLLRRKEEEGLTPPLDVCRFFFFSADKERPRPQPQTLDPKPREERNPNCSLLFSFILSFLSRVSSHLSEWTPIPDTPKCRAHAGLLPCLSFIYIQEFWHKSIVKGERERGMALSRLWEILKNQSRDGQVRKEGEDTEQSAYLKRLTQSWKISSIQKVFRKRT